MSVLVLLDIVITDKQTNLSADIRFRDMPARLLDKPNEDKLAGEKSHLMHRKYGWSDGLIVELIHTKNKLNKDMTDEILIEVGSQKCKS